MAKLYCIQKCKGKDDFDNFCFQETDGGLYYKDDAIRILEKGNGGSMADGKGNSYMVNYDKSKNKWLEDI